MLRRWDICHEGMQQANHSRLMSIFEETNPTVNPSSPGGGNHQVQGIGGAQAHDGQRNDVQS
jgi:hypothetical protein